jgi:hypothetical protein
MLCKIFEAEIAEKKRFLRRFLNAAQIILLLINVLTIGFMTASGVQNVRGSDQYLQYAGTEGDNTTILDNANDINNVANTHEGVSAPLP